MNYPVVITAAVILALAVLGASIVLLGSYELRSRRRGSAGGQEQATSPPNLAIAPVGGVQGNVVAEDLPANAMAPHRTAKDGLPPNVAAQHRTDDDGFPAEAVAGERTGDPGPDAGEPSASLLQRRKQLANPRTLVDSFLPTGAATLDRIAAAAQQVNRELGEIGAASLMPYRSHVDADGSLTAVEVQPIPESFLEDGGDPEVPRTLRSRRDLAAEHRVRIARDIGRLLEALHERDIAFGNVQWSNLLVSDGSQPSVLVRGLQYARPMGEGSAVIGAIDPDWRTEQDPGEPTFDVDRYQYALLLLRFVGEAGPLARLTERPLGTSGLEAFHYPAGARLLFDRAAGPVGSRPTIREWLTVLTELD